ncbi:unnamed protein product [Ectocarpus sp. 12 AP-2014]
MLPLLIPTPGHPTATLGPPAGDLKSYVVAPNLSSNNLSCLRRGRFPTPKPPTGTVHVPREVCVLFRSTYHISLCPTVVPQSPLVLHSLWRGAPSLAPPGMALHGTEYPVLLSYCEPARTAAVSGC